MGLATVIIKGGESLLRGRARGITAQGIAWSVGSLLTVSLGHTGFSAGIKK
tara:strand:- start:189 stop:341 length:153 start_codon:yes stop_codon:yes gene_type:complete